MRGCVFRRDKPMMICTQPQPGRCGAVLGWAAAVLRVAAITACVIVAPMPVAAPDLPIIAITEIQASVDSGRWADFKNSKAANFQNMLETQLVKVGRFKIIERNRVDEVLSEQALQGEFSDTDTVLAIGAVDYIVYGSVTKFGSTEKALSTRTFRATSRVTEFGIDLKVVDALNGEVRKAENVEVSVSSGNATETRGLSVGAGAADPLADVQREAAKKAAAAVAESIFPIEVVAFQEDASHACCAYLNYGEAVLTLGDRLKVVEQSAPLVDETTGLNLGAVETTIGVIEVIEVLEQFSKARSVSGEIPRQGQVARILPSQAMRRSTSEDQRQRLGRKI